MLDLDAIRAAAKLHTQTIARCSTRSTVAHTPMEDEIAPTEAPAPVMDTLLSVEPTPATPPPRPIPWFHLDADWRKDYAAWQAHRDTCPTCSASERTAATAGTGIRCKLGQRLHTAYESALDSSPT